ncbi:MAG: helix-turn-helix domain-containing protein [Phenylobacterium sp.]|uniref:helix-turn-helix domain-containing protein n=1 Tax=Phenylobacterium sp. TaxID=1871053 RepID=UPI0025DF20BD|nr:helix-turn-helix domain-containing protein [Phenylobacterium sp.]MCA3550132.1 helix-turn-helix domain-containing protein [Rhodobacter sp.]MCA6264698.1 helix-turn-helix domain-containing protein [Phenylobacterium sp.]MCA6269174.1 helix-turn-helix domain-containing protein [Phenylobacterium sp.]MCA6274460.1 helix-turn-helix domain-containing protein [Phenylobacterium sp.]MCA6282032.1 helix-turn-helix domain-containing protein [Phenylobacterium sp.]
MVKRIDLKTIRCTDFANLAGFSKAHASELLNGRKTPSLKLAVDLERRFGIPPRRWVEMTEAAAND